MSDCTVEARFSGPQFSGFRDLAVSRFGRTSSGQDRYTESHTGLTQTKAMEFSTGSMAYVTSTTS